MQVYHIQKVGMHINKRLFTLEDTLLLFIIRTKATKSQF